MGATAGVLDTTNANTEAGIGVNNSATLDDNTFLVGISFIPVLSIHIPKEFLLRVTPDAIEFLSMPTYTELERFPYETITAWRSMANLFVFDVLSASVKGRTKGRPDDIIQFKLKANESKRIETAVLYAVESAMSISSPLILTNQDFRELVYELLLQNQLSTDWRSILEWHTTGHKKFQAQQAVELIERINLLAPFEKYDIACILVSKLLHHHALPLLINTFTDVVDKNNLLHRLKPAFPENIESIMNSNAGYVNTHRSILHNDLQKNTSPVEADNPGIANKASAGVNSPNRTLESERKKSISMNMSCINEEDLFK